MLIFFHRSFVISKKMNGMKVEVVVTPVENLSKLLDCLNLIFWVTPSTTKIIRNIGNKNQT
jgi:hypothetical protein